MSHRSEYFRMSDAFHAPIMASIATTEDCTRMELCAMHHMQENQVATTVRELEARGLVAQYPVTKNHKYGRLPLAAHPTDRFWDDFAKAVAHAGTLKATDHQLYRDAIWERKKAASHRESSLLYKRAFSTYLGRTAYLGEYYDLAEHVNWFSGVPGWQALVTVEALAPKP